MTGVDIEALRAAGQALAKAADSIADLDPATPVEPVPAAMDGSATGLAALGVATRLAAGTQVYATRVRGLSESATASAAGYRDTDDPIAVLLGKLTR